MVMRRTLRSAFVGLVVPAAALAARVTRQLAGFDMNVLAPSE
jgi:hypothetical protein